MSASNPQNGSRRGPFRRALAWLLQLDRPAPLRSHDEIAAEVERNYTWNVVVNVADGALFWFGASFISSTTILPLFVSRLTDDPLPIGLIAVIAQGGWFLPQLFTANFVERLARKKPLVINAGLFLERLPVWLMVLAAALAGGAPGLALGVLLSGYAWHGFGAGLVATSWQDLIARCFPVERRGRFMGLTNFLGAGSGALGGLLSAWLLKTLPFPRNFQATFAIAAAAITLSWAVLALTREPAQPSTAPRRSSRQFVAGLPELLRRDQNFRRFLVARLLMALGGMGNGFITVAAVQRWQIPDSVGGLYTIALLAGQTVTNLALGLLADRRGHKLSLEFGILGSLLGFLIAWLAPTPGWYFVAFFAMGAGTGAVFLSGILVVMEFAEPERRPTYVGIGNTGVGLVGMAAPLIGALLARSSYSLVFAASAAIMLAALGLMHWWVRDPRWAKQV